MSDPKRTLILGIGNILLADEGIGVRVIEHLQGLDLPGHVECVDGGTAGADLLDILCNRERVIVVDAMDAGRPPGTIVQLSLEDLRAAERPALSLHDLDLPQTLEMACLLGCAPREVIFLGIQPETVECRMGLSPILTSVIPKAAAKVRSCLEHGSASD